MAGSLHAWISSGILTIVSIVLWLRLGFSQGRKRAQAWAAVALLNVLWALDLGVILKRETGVTAALLAVVFVIIAVHRARLDNPDGKVAQWIERNRWFPTFRDRGTPSHPDMG